MKCQCDIKHQYTLTRMAIIKKTDHTKYWDSEQQLELSTAADGNVKRTIILEKRWQFLKKLNRYLSDDLCIQPLGIYPREMKAYAHMLVQRLVH